MDHDHSLLAKPDLVPRNNEVGNGTTKEVLPSEWLLWNVISREAIPKDMRDIKLTAWKLLSQSVPGMENHTFGQRVPERITNECLNSGVPSEEYALT